MACERGDVQELPARLLALWWRRWRSWIGDGDGDVPAAPPPACGCLARCGEAGGVPSTGELLARRQLLRAVAPLRPPDVDRLPARGEPAALAGTELRRKAPPGEAGGEGDATSTAWLERLGGGGGGPAAAGAAAPPERCFGSRVHGCGMLFALTSPRAGGRARGGSA
jgi:hypothetical protein